MSAVYEWVVVMKRTPEHATDPGREILNIVANYYEFDSDKRTVAFFDAEGEQLGAGTSVLYFYRKNHGTHGG